MKLEFDKINYESDHGFTKHERNMRYDLCYHNGYCPELKTAAKMLQRWGMTNSVMRFDAEWRNLFWVVTGVRGCRQHLAALEAMPPWIYGDKNTPFTGVRVFDHLRLFRNPDGTKRLLVCMDYPEEDVERLREMADRYRLSFALVYVDRDDGMRRWPFNCLANFELD